MEPGPRAVPPGDERPRGVRGRRRPGRVGQAGRLGRGRGRHGGDARAPVPRGVMNMTDRVVCDIDELRTLFLFEKLTDEQLRWLCERGGIESHEPGFVIREGEPATCFYVLLEGTIALQRRVGGDDVETSRTSQRGVYAGAWSAFLGDEAAKNYTASMRAITPSRFFVLSA